MAGSAARPVHTSASRPHVIRQPEGSAVSVHVLKITGISDPDLDRGITDSEVCYMLFEAGCDVAAPNSSSRLIKKALNGPALMGYYSYITGFVGPVISKANQRQ